MGGARTMARILHKPEPRLFSLAPLSQPQNKTVRPAVCDTSSRGSRTVEPREIRLPDEVGPGTFRWLAGSARSTLPARLLTCVLISFAFNEAKGVIGGLSFLGGDDYKTSAELV